MSFLLLLLFVCIGYGVPNVVADNVLTFGDKGGKIYYLLREVYDAWETVVQTNNGFRIARYVHTNEPRKQDFAVCSEAGVHQILRFTMREGGMSFKGYSPMREVRKQAVDSNGVALCPKHNMAPMCIGVGKEPELNGITWRADDPQNPRQGMGVFTCDGVRVCFSMDGQCMLQALDSFDDNDEKSAMAFSPSSGSFECDGKKDVPLKNHEGMGKETERMRNERDEGKSPVNTPKAAIREEVRKSAKEDLKYSTSFDRVEHGSSNAPKSGSDGSQFSGGVYEKYFSVKHTEIGRAPIRNAEDSVVSSGLIGEYGKCYPVETLMEGKSTPFFLKRYQPVRVSKSFLRCNESDFERLSVQLKGKGAEKHLDVFSLVGQGQSGLRYERFSFVCFNSQEGVKMPNFTYISTWLYAD